MADQPRKISEEPVANTVGVNDRVVILFNANTTSPSVRTISFDNLRQVMFASAPVYANNAEATANSEPVGAIYQTSNGEIRIVV